MAIKYTTREFLIVILLIGVACGWAIDHIQLKRAASRAELSATLWHPNYMVRRREARRLAKDPRANISELLFLLTDPDNIVRTESLSALQKLPSSEFNSQTELKTLFDDK